MKMNKFMLKRNLVLAGSVVVVGVPLAWYGYELYRGKSPSQIHEERLHDPKNILKDNVNDISGNKDDSSWRSWLDWESDKTIDNAQDLKNKSTAQIKQKLDDANKTVDHIISSSDLGTEAEHKVEDVKAAAHDSSWFGWLWRDQKVPEDDEAAVRKSVQGLTDTVPKKVEKELAWIKKTTHESADGGREATKATVKDNTRAAHDLGQEIADMAGQKVEEGKNVAQNVAQDATNTVNYYGQGFTDKMRHKVEQGKEAAKHACEDIKNLLAHEGHHVKDEIGQKVEEGKAATRNAVHDTKHAVQQRGQELADKAGQKVDHGKTTAKDAYYDAKDSAQEQGSEMVDKAKEVKNETGWFGSGKKADR